MRIDLRNKKKFQVAAKVLTVVTLAVLFLGVSSLVFIYDQAAEISVALVYFLLLALLLIKTIELAKSKNFLESDLGSKQKPAGPAVKAFGPVRFFPQKDRLKRWQQFVNFSLLVVFFVIFGASATKEGHIVRFLTLSFLVILVNLVLLNYYAKSKKLASFDYFNTRPPETLYGFFRKFLSRKENLMVIIINFGLLSVISFVFKFNFSNYAKVLVVVFLLTLINVIIYADIKNAKFQNN